MEMHGLYNIWGFAVGELSAGLQPCPPLRTAIKMTHGSNGEVQDSRTPTLSSDCLEGLIGQDGSYWTVGSLCPETSIRCFLLNHWWKLWLTSSQVSLWPEKKAQHIDWLNLTQVLLGAGVRVEECVGDFDDHVLWWGSGWKIHGHAGQESMNNI